MLVAVILFILIANVDGYDYGAPDSACSDLVPSGHGGTKQTSISPYTISFSSPTFMAQGSPVSVTLAGGTGTLFEGFLLTTQYDNSSDQLLKVGTFPTPAAGMKLVCNTNQGVTHANNNGKPSITVQWTPPAISLGHVRFRATFVQTKLTYWVDVTKLLYDSALGIPPSTVAPVTTTAAPTPTGSIVKDTACGKTKGCYSVCSGSSCSFLIMWEAVPGDVSRVLITMKGNVGSDTSRYIAFGLSTDSKMDSDSVQYCMNQPNAAFTAWNTAGRKSNTQLADNKSGLSNITISSVNGILTCTFQRLIAAASDANGQRFALNNKYTILWATGPGYTSGVGEHDASPVISAQMAALTDFTADIGGGAESLLVKAHGSLMLIAWVFAASIGIVFSRYFKDAWEDKKLFDQKIWFQIHRAAMVIVLLATATAFIIIFIEADGYSEVGDEGHKKAHPILGIIVMALTVINPFMSLFRCAPGTKNRPIFNWAHWAVGNIAYILGIITIFFGFTLEKSRAPTYAIYVMAAFVVWQGCLQLILELLQFIAKNSGRHEEYEMSDMANGGKGSVKKPNTLVKTVLGGIHILVVTGFVIALIVIFNVGEDHDED